MTDKERVSTWRCEVEELEQKREKILAACKKLSDEQFHAEPPHGKWSVEQELRHLVMAEDIYFRYSYRSDSRYPHQIGVPPHWLSSAQPTPYSPAGIDEVSAALADVHSTTTEVLATLTEEQLAEECEHKGPGGQETLESLLHTLVVHEAHHMGRLDKKLRHLTGRKNARN